MRIATWNVNSLTARLARVEEWLEYARPDILCMQETKVSDGAFPSMPLSALGYETVSNGEGRWNGVAIASRVGAEDVQRGFGTEADEQGARLVAATCGGIRVHSIYVPNGRAVGSEFYEAKLAWLEELRRFLDRTCRPADPVVVAGDFNVAPDDRDVWDPAAFVGATHVSAAERDALAAILALGLEDVWRRHHEDGGVFSWWDYRAGDFHQGRGMRIDLVLLGHALAEKSTSALIDRDARKGKKPSDHAPVVVEIDR